MQYKQFHFLFKLQESGLGFFKKNNCYTIDNSLSHITFATGVSEFLAISRSSEWNDNFSYTLNTLNTLQNKHSLLLNIGVL